MSWTVNGQVYHSSAEDERARARERERSLRRMAEQFRVPDAESASVEQRLAATQAQRTIVQRTLAAVARDEERIDAATRALSGDLRASFDALKAEEQAVRDTLATSSRRLAEQIAALEAERAAQSRAVAAQLSREEAHDAEADTRATARAQTLLASADEALSAVSRERVVELGLDTSVVDQLRAQAARAQGIESLQLAREAHDLALGLAAEVRWREARISTLKVAQLAEVAVLREALAFSESDRAELVGTGEAALDRPLHGELNRLEAQIERVRLYDSLDARIDEITSALDRIAPKVSSLAGQVAEFDRLDAARLDLVRTKLQAELTQIIGEPLRNVSEHVPALGLQPVEVRFQTSAGEIVDCAVGLDGSLHVHHHGHANQRTCAEAAKRLAASVPRLIKMTTRPALDIHQAGTSTSPASAEQTRKNVQ